MTRVKHGESESHWEPYSIDIANTLTTAQTLDMATSILGVSRTFYLCAKVVRKVIVAHFPLPR